MANDRPTRLNYGCGYDKRPGYLNVDIDPACEPDILLTAGDLSPLRGEPFEEVLAHDVIEHIPRTQTLRSLLEWNDLLAPGGTLRLETSSLIGVADRARSSKSFAEEYDWTICMFGNQMHPGDFHYTGFTDTTLRVHLLAAGFEVERTWLTDRWLLHADATKTTGWSADLDDWVDLDDSAFVSAAADRALGSADAAPGDLAHRLAAGALDRRGAYLELLSSPARLMAAATAHGYEPDSPSIPLPDRIRAVTPALLRPHLRRVRFAWRAAAERTRRRIGARRHRSTRF